MRHMTLLLLAILAWAQQPALAEDAVPVTHDLQKDGQLAHARRGVVLVLVSRPNCHYCRSVLSDILEPMSRNPDYQAKLVMRRVEDGDTTDLRDFDGSLTEAHEFAAKWEVTVVPTVMVFDGAGRLLAKPLIGLTTLDYYAYYLDQIIDVGLAKVRGKPIPASPAALTAP